MHGTPQKVEVHRERQKAVEICQNLAYFKVFFARHHLSLAKTRSSAKAAEGL